MRYFARISYRGTRYFGWQRQPAQVSVQEVIEEKMSLMLRTSLEITGCGRTDTGVHAKNYYFHFDYPGPLPESLAHRLDRFLPEDIAVHEIIPVHETAHARFDALSRTYQYFMGRYKDPFHKDVRWHFHGLDSLDLNAMQEAANALKDYDSYGPFCKSHSSAKTMLCRLDDAYWASDQEGLVFTITADRFLRGMVRLIVGMCVSVGMGKMTLDDLHRCMDAQIPLPHAYAVPAEGLFLCSIRYAYLETI
jgi:tRNA pseudouridine38-40 synthase